MGTGFRGRDSGVYLLAVWLPRARRLAVGRLGRVTVAPGLYLYAGSARRGLAARLRRHARRVKPMVWHIDYLRRHARLVAAAVVPWRPGRECRVAHAALRLPGARVPVPRFGSSDCRCPSHLAYLGPTRRR